MSKATRRSPAKKRPSRSGAAWPRRSPAVVVELGPVEHETLAVLLALRTELGREPEPPEVARRLGLSARNVRASIATLARLGLPAKLTETKQRCLRAIIALEARLGHSPSTREVSAEMGLAPSGSRFHINALVALGLVTPPEVRLMLSATPAGRAHVPAT